MNTFGPTAIAIKHHNEVFKPGNIVQPYSVEALKDHEYINYKVVAESTWERKFPKKKIIFDIYGEYNKNAIRALNIFFPMQSEIVTKDGRFSIMRVGLDIETHSVGIAIQEVPWHDFMYQSAHFLIATETFPELERLIWQEIEEEQNDIYS